jgi:Fe-S oxidoreductase/FAD/FMN-containing dehydrogenase
MAVDHLLEVKVLLSDGSTAHFRPLDSTELAQHYEKNGLEGQIYRTIGRLVADEANRDIIRRGTPGHWRRCGGYNLGRFINDGSIDHYTMSDPRFNLANLIAGAEGTLAIITELKLNLVPRPKMTALAIVEFDDLQASLEAVPAILETQPSAVELLDNLGLTMAREVPAYARLMRTFLAGTPFCLHVTEFYGESEAELRAKIDHLRDHLRRPGVKASAINAVFDPQQQANVWKVRKAGLGLLMSVRSDYKPIPFIEDTAVPVEHLAEYIPRLEKFCSSLGTRMVYYAHASAGCLHIRPMVNPKLATEIGKMVVIQEFTAELLHQYGGAFSSEHGDGRARSWLNAHFFGPELYDLFKQVKAVFDPHHLLNPGNIIAAPMMTEHLRFGQDYKVMALQTHLHFAESLPMAIEMCNGAGVCRKLTTGAMCPSFMATREEEDSTRGRANMLRAALSGRLPHQELVSPRMYQVMELCVSCKACKSECPSSVDMAKIKTEFLAHYFQVHRRPWRDYLFGYVTLLSRLNSGAQAPLVNWILHHKSVRAFLARYFGIDPHHDLPQYARLPFTTWFKRRELNNEQLTMNNEQPASNSQFPIPNSQASNPSASLRTSPPPLPSFSVAQNESSNLPIFQSFGSAQDRPSNLPTPRVALFNDTLNTYTYPHVSIAATEVLEAAGFQVVLPGVTDCGRPAMSKGLVKLARKLATRALDQLYPLARAELPIIFLEPSDLSMVADDFAALLPDDERVAVVARQSLSFEQFIAGLAGEGRLKLAFTAETRHIVFHGHCHQKSLFGSKAAHQALTLPPNYTVEEVDTSCCGMAGSFGYEAEHYDISLRMAERRLLPAIRAASPETLIVATGLSCRQQIKHGSGRLALHPAEVLRQALIEKDL